MDDLLPDAVLDPVRLAAVRDSGLLDTPPEEPFDRLARVAATALRTPLAFVTVVDDSRSFWKSCIGLDGDGELVRQNAINESFCQYVVSSGQPLITGDATSDPITQDNPSIAAMGVRAWAGMPLRSPDGEVLGTFCVVDTVPREWTDAEIEVLATLADAATGEVALRAALERTSALARTLQLSLLPPQLPTVEGLDVAGRFRPARDGQGVLGDFYDVFETQPDRWFVAIGDVRGHGPLAAETVASVRWSIRAAAARTTHPAAVLEQVNRQLAQRPDVEAPHITAALLTFTSAGLSGEGPVDGLQLAVTTAGHPPPLLRRADGRVEQVAPSGRPLGMFDQADLDVSLVSLAPGESVVLVTDGVLEARGPGGRLLDDVGLARALADAPGDLDAHGICELVVDAARAHQDGPLRDDAAVVVLRHPPVGRSADPAPRPRQR